jgi:hypothetical protein
VPELSRKARLSTIRNLCRHDSSHRCIVQGLFVQGNARNARPSRETPHNPVPHRPVPGAGVIV